MTRGNIIINIKNIKDIEKITDDTKYINIDVQNVDNKILDYFLLNGKNYSYAELIDNRPGFIYASYDMFSTGENILNNIIDNMPSNLSKIEVVRYLYTTLGKILSVDINTIEDKNEIISFNKISLVNNIWGALSKRKVNDVVASKIFMYLCSKMNIECELINTNIKGNIANKVYLENSFIIVDLFNDIYNIGSGFITKYFDKYNDNKDIDKKINYIKDEYMNYYIDNALKDLDYTEENILYNILSLTNNIINIYSIGPYELFKIYKEIFEKYVPNYEININNLFVIGKAREKDHFIVFSYNEKYYSYNYNKRCFVNIDYSTLKENINNNKIGVYSDEKFEIRERSVVL